MFSFKDGEEQWKNATEEPLEYNYVETVTLSDLKPNSIYQVRVFGFHKIEDLNQLSEPLLNDSITIYTCTTRSKGKGNKVEGSKVKGSKEERSKEQEREVEGSNEDLDDY